MPTALSLFAGIGGFDLGLDRAGFTVVGQVELDPFCQRVLAARWPGVERAGDVRGVSREHRREDLQERGGSSSEDLAEGRPDIDLLVGGFPCQDLSVAGKRAGLGGSRSGLFWEIVRIAKATRPTWGLFENVPGLVSSHRGRDMETVLAGLRECWPVVGYRILDSRYFGVAQRRRRVFFVCGPTEAGVAQVLALTEGGDGDSAAGGEAGTDVARPVIASTLNSGGNNEGFRTEPGEHVAVGSLPALDTPRGHAGVRRLTPVECERLQGFPDGWTCLCQSLAAYAADPDAAALACTCPDSPRYRALGNAVTVNVIEWIGRRLLDAWR